VNQLRTKAILPTIRPPQGGGPQLTLALYWLVALCAGALGLWCIVANRTMVGASAVSAMTAGHGPSAASNSKPNVVVITIDTLRADHLGVYGDNTIQTPAIDQLARSGARFTHAYTPIPITLPAHTTIFTGSYPMATGMHDFSGNKLAPNIPTLATVLSKNGYQTAAFIGAAVLDSRFGLNQGFETYFDHFDFNRLDETNIDLMERRGDLVAVSYTHLTLPTICSV